MTVEIREIKHKELKDLFHLYKQLKADDMKLNDADALMRLWNEIYYDPNLYYIVAAVDNKIVSTCNISIIKNLTHNLRPFGIIENVVTDIEYRNNGYGKRVLDKAVDIAKKNNCYKVMLMTGSKSKEVLKFYEYVGFEKGIKTGFIKKLD